MRKEDFDDMVNRYLSGEASPAEERLIEEFFSSQERKASLDQTATDAMWMSIANRITPKDDPVSKGRQRMFLRLAGVFTFATVAVVLSMLFLNVNPFGKQDEELSWVTLGTPYGQKSIITLADGSRIFLNAGSSIRYPESFPPGKREVKLSGEAFFEIAKDPERPFTVITGDVITKVLGTSFNVQAFPSRQISVTVASGVVQVQASESPRAVSVDSLAPTTVILKPNDRAIYDARHSAFTVTEVNIEKYLAWKDNTLLFDNIALEEVAKLLERWYNVSIRFDNDRIKPCRINGKYKDQSLESVLRSIQYMYRIDFEFSDQNTVHLTGEGCSSSSLNSS